MTDTVKVLIMRELGFDPAIPMPSYQSIGAAGADLRANVPHGSITLQPFERVSVPTGLRVQVPDGYEIQIRPRSGLALKYGLTLVNAPGTIDSDYRGPLYVLLMNTGPDPFEICHGHRIAQMVVAPIVRAQFEVTDHLCPTERGMGGFGSTGTD
ncbi:MAG: dUTP diphosphatase [Aestuariivita sp.]|nr:dUTP diphosphatase [Aestuariivita sp.]